MRDLRSLLPLAILCAACGGGEERTSPPATPTSTAPEPPAIEVAEITHGSAAEPSDAAPLVVAPDAIRVGTAAPIVTLVDGRVRAADRQGEDGFLIIALREPPAALPASPAAVPLAIHPDVPHRTVVEVLYTLGQAERRDFELRVRRDGHPAALSIALPSVRHVLLGTSGEDGDAMADVLGGGAAVEDVMAEAEGVGVASSSDGDGDGDEPPPPAEVRAEAVPEPDEEASSLNLNALITEGGITVAGSGGFLAPGCQRVQRGTSVPTLPRVDGALDIAGFQRCLASVKEMFSEETVIIVSADPEVRFRDVAAVIAASRGMGDAELFPVTVMSIANR